MKKTEQISACQLSFEIFGDRWNLKIVDVLRNEALRFNDIMRELSINTATLSGRLRQLEELNLLNRIEQSCDKQSVAYELTALGKELLPVIDDMLKLSSKLAKSATQN